MEQIKEDILRLKYDPFKKGKGTILSRYPELSEFSEFIVLYGKEFPAGFADWVMQMIFLLYQNGSPVLREENVEARRRSAEVLLEGDFSFDIGEPLIAEAVVRFLRVQNSPVYALIAVGEERFYYLLAETLKDTGTLTADKKAQAEQRKTENFKDAEELLTKVQAHKLKLVADLKEKTGIEVSPDAITERPSVVVRKSINEHYAKKTGAAN